MALPNMAGVKCVLLDIEGTVCPISFVKDVLFPYAIKALPDYLAEKWDSAEFQPYRDAFPEEHRTDPDALQAHVEDLTKRDVKIAYLKNLQGLLWKDGYETGAYSTSIFPDVVPALRQWKKDGYALAIYSSGSVFAQKLLFGHVQSTETPAPKKRSRPAEEQASEGAAPPPAKKLATGSGEAVESSSRTDDATTRETHDDVPGVAPAETSNGNGEAPESTSKDSTKDEGIANGQLSESTSPQTEDLTDLFSGWFDTTNAGLKTVKDSYVKISQALEYGAGEVLFLSDNVKEVDAAIEAEMKSIVVDRPGNGPLSNTDRERLQVVEALTEITLKKEAANNP